MSLVQSFLSRRRCPLDGTMLQGRFYWCRSCRSMWGPLFDGTGTPEAEPFGADAEDPRAYLRRKLHELDNHRLSTATPPPRSLLRRQGGSAYGTLMNPAKSAAFSATRAGRRLIEETQAEARSLDTPVIGRVYK